MFVYFVFSVYLVFVFSIVIVIVFYFNFLLMFCAYFINVCIYLKEEVQKELQEEVHAPSLKDKDP